MENVTLPKYHGYNDNYLSCHQFLFIIEELGRVNLWSDAKLLQIVSEKCLQTEALEWFSTCPCSSFDSLKVSMMSYFAPKISLKDKIELKNSLVQEEEENVEIFYKRCKNVFDTINDQKHNDLINERELLMSFLQGLKSDIQEIVMKSDAKRNLEFLEAAIKG